MYRRRLLLPKNECALLAILLIAFGIMLASCRDDLVPNENLKNGFSDIVFVTRAAPSNSGSLVVEDEFRPGGNVWLLAPASLGGALTNLTKMSDGDVQGIDVSPDGKSLIAALRTDRADSFHLVELDLGKAASEPCFTPQGDTGPACRQLTFGPASDTQPFYMQDGRVAFLRADPDGPVDFLGRDRARVLMAVDADAAAIERIDYGAGHALGVSTLRSGWVRLVRWTLREGEPAFVPMLIDPSGSRSEQVDGSPADQVGIPSSVYEDSQGRQFADCVPANRTWGAGTLCQRNDDGQWSNIVADIFESQTCSPAGRLQNALPLKDGNFLVSYAQSLEECLDASDELRGLTPDFELDVLDPSGNKRWLIQNTRGLSDLYPRPIMPRALLDPNVVLPQRPDLGCQEDSVLFEGVIEQQRLDDGAVMLRVLEGLSGAEAPWSMDLFGGEVGAICGSDTNGDGKGDVFEAPVFSDGSFRFSAPASVPLRIQLLDAYGAAMATDPVWRGGPPCSSRRCDGCHANQGEPAGFDISQAAAKPPTSLDGPASIRKSFDFRRDIQGEDINNSDKILNKYCISCHNSSDPQSNYVTLENLPYGIDLSDRSWGQTSGSYQTLLFYDVLRDLSGELLESRWAFVEPGNARKSRLVQRLGAPCRFGCKTNDDPWAPWGMPKDKKHGGDLTDDERYQIIQWIDAGAPFYGIGSKP